MFLIQLIRGLLECSLLKVQQSNAKSKINSARAPSARAPKQECDDPITIT